MSIAQQRPAFIITVDTEGDDLWSCPDRPTTRNSAAIPRFQELCERHGLRPTYLVDYEMALCPVFGELAADVLARNTAEVGMHLHAATTPPARAPVVASDDRSPLLGEYTEQAMREKIVTQTRLLEDRLGCRPVSHRGGRWSFDERYARILVEQGYEVDCSVTPGIDWRSVIDRPGAPGVPDYRGFPRGSYFLDPDDVSRPGRSSLLEVPMTIEMRRAEMFERARAALPRGSFGRRVVDRLLPAAEWLRPNGRNLRSMLSILRSEQVSVSGYAEMMIHSSELLPAASPLFPSERSVEVLFEHLDGLFEAAAEGFEAATLAEWHASVVGGLRRAEGVREDGVLRGRRADSSALEHRATREAPGAHPSH